MKSFEVRVSGSLENTGLDCRFFATREEAERAAHVIHLWHPRATAEVCEANEEPDLTFEEWNESE